MNWLYEHSKRTPNKIFINKLTYRDVYVKTIVLAIKMKKFIGNENRIAIISNNSIEFALFILASMNLEAEVLLLNSRLKRSEIEERIMELNISVVFSEDDSFISFNKVFNSEADNNISLQSNLKEDDNRVLFIMNTSATTGRFKSVPIRLGVIKNHVEASKDALGYSQNDNWLLVLPMFHIGGLSILLRSLFNGTAITIVNKFKEDTVLKHINSRNINMISMVPTMFRRIIDGIEDHNLRVMLLSGEFIDDELVRRAIKINIPVYKSYGMTETTSQIISFNVMNNIDKLKSVGKPLKFVEVKIQPGKSKEYTNEGYLIGEVLLKAPMIMKGYIGRDEICGYFNTEDIGYLDNDGFLYILDRRSNLIISGGENIYPLEIENILYKNKKIKECAIVAKKDKKWGQIPVLYVVSHMTEDEIIEYLKKYLANYKLPKKIIHKESLPKNATGKIVKKLLGSDTDEVKNC